VYAHFHELARWIRPALLGEGAAPRMVVDSVDLQYVRHLREAELLASESARTEAVDGSSAELLEYATADVVVVATEDDGRRLAEDLGPSRTLVLTTIHRARDVVPAPEGREGILFVGGYDHPPNVDAVEWLMEEIAPRLAERGCDGRIVVAGSRMPLELARLVDRRGGEVLGFVPRLQPVYDRVRCSVAPLRFGAGMKGKIGESLAAGLPAATTRIGAEGFPVGDGILVADDADGIAEHLHRLVVDDTLWVRASEAGRAMVREHLGPDRCRAAIRDILASTPGFTARADGTVEL
jgi:glycosyltransferase involved in cell wall biosynthesis